MRHNINSELFSRSHYLQAQSHFLQPKHAFPLYFQLGPLRSSCNSRRCIQHLLSLQSGARHYFLVAGVHVTLRLLITLLADLKPTQQSKLRDSTLYNGSRYVNYVRLFHHTTLLGFDRTSILA